MRWARIFVTVVMVVSTTACGGITDVIEDQMTAQTQPAAAGDGGNTGGGSGSTDEGDPTAFRLGRAGWENTCDVVSPEEVAAATGYTVTDARESGGCSWIIEPVDDVVAVDPAIGWLPMTARSVDVQRESAPRASSDIVLDPITGLGTQAFWMGNTVNSLGEVWVQTEQIGFRVVNQFASVNYEGDTRASMEALAAALVAALAQMDVVAASGDSGWTLIPPDRVDLPEGIATMDAMIDELAAVPLPAGAVIGFGDTYPDRASQDVYLDLSVGDAARFFLEALPAAGFEITPGSDLASVDEVLEFAAQSISFIDPDGRRGDIGIREGAFAPTQLNIQIFNS